MLFCCPWNMILWLKSLFPWILPFVMANHVLAVPVSWFIKSLNILKRVKIFVRFGSIIPRLHRITSGQQFVMPLLWRAIKNTYLLTKHPNCCRFSFLMRTFPHCWKEKFPPLVFQQNACPLVAGISLFCKKPAYGAPPSSRGTKISSNFQLWGQKVSWW